MSTFIVVKSKSKLCNRATYIREFKLTFFAYIYIYIYIYKHQSCSKITWLSLRRLLPAVLRGRCFHMNIPPIVSFKKDFLTLVTKQNYNECSEEFLGDQILYLLHLFVFLTTQNLFPCSKRFPYP